MQESASSRTAIHADRDNSTVFGVLLGIGVLSFWLLWASSLGHKVVALWGGTTDAETKLSAAGQFGDMFGGVNALFTALAFSAVAWSAFMQRREMKMQRDELQAQREQLELQRLEMQSTRSVIAQQAFESTFFKMIEVCRSLHDGIRLDGDGLSHGNAVREIAKQCRSRCIMEGEALAKEGYLADEVREWIGKYYEQLVYPGSRQYLAPYFRSLYHLFKLIAAREDLTPQQRRDYGNLARANISGEMLTILATNACASVGDGFGPYIEDFSLLKHLELEPQVLATVRLCFSPAAFGAPQFHRWPR